MELLPHISRLIPMADLFFTGKIAKDEANEAVLQTLATKIGTDLAKVSAAHDGLHRQLQALDAGLDRLQAEAEQTQATVTAQAKLLSHLEDRLAAILLWIRVAVLLLVVVFVGVVIGLVHQW
jgi:hypothetical protein